MWVAVLVLLFAVLGGFAGEVLGLPLWAVLAFAVLAGVGGVVVGRLIAARRQPRPSRSLALRVINGVLAAAVATGLLLTFYGLSIEPRLIDERHHTVAIPGLPAAWDGAEVAVFSDLQLGMFLANTGTVERIVERAVDEDPGAVLIPGDFLYSTDPDLTTQVDTVVDLLRPITDAGIPTYVVLGNHDHALGAADRLTAALEDAGVRVLLNESAVVPGGAGGAGDLYVVGLGPHRPGLARPEQALADVPPDAPRLVLMHNPRSFPQMPAGTAPLAVAGHTHCGQIAIPGTPAWSYLELRAEERVVVDGFAPETYGARGNQLFVTCGIGFSLVPIRINARPQVVFFELTTAT